MFQALHFLVTVLSTVMRGAASRVWLTARPACCKTADRPYASSKLHIMDARHAI